MKGPAARLVRAAAAPRDYRHAERTEDCAVGRRLGDKRGNFNKVLIIFSPLGRALIALETDVV